MEEINTLLGIPTLLLSKTDILWSFILLVARFTGLFFVAPGIGGGVLGMPIRVPAILMFAAVSVVNCTYAAVPDSIPLMAAGVAVELLCGVGIGLIPFCVISAVQTGAQIASTSMGLGVSQLIDPTSGGQISDLSRVYGDLSVIVFLMLGGHLILIQAASGLGGALPPGSFMISDLTVALLIERTGHIFAAGTMVSAPIVVALLLTQFVMGLISKAVPTVNIFIVSFPLTIGIGLTIAIILIPELVVFVNREFGSVEPSLLTFLGR